MSLSSWFGLGSLTTDDDDDDAPPVAAAAAPPSNPSIGSSPSRTRQQRQQQQEADMADLRSARSRSPDPPGVNPNTDVGVTNYQSMGCDNQEDALRTTPSTRNNNNNSRRRQQQQKRQQQQSSSSPRTATSSSLSPTISSAVTQTQSSATQSAATTNYRGFSTSVGDMFANPHQERVDCCAMVCCGIFQSDRDRYLLQGVTPPSPWKRIWIHVFIPLLFFFMAGYMAFHVPSVVWNELTCLFFLLFLLGCFLAQCQKGRMKRMEIRKDVLWYKYQLLQHNNNSADDDDDNNNNTRGGFSLDQILDQPRPDEDDGSYYYRGQTARDIGCAHPYCFMLGCYPTDRPMHGAPQLLAAQGDANQVEESLCSCLFKTLCGFPVCGMFCQLGGICGMAQESREIESTLLPPAYRRLDYVSMQPMLTYYREVYNQRWRQFHTLNTSGPEGPRAVGPFSCSMFQEWPPLSGLSKMILQGWAALNVFLGIWSLVGPLFWTQLVKGEGRRHYFSVSDFVVYMASWLVCFLTLAIVVYFCQRGSKPLELSMDAMIKFFASGFVLSTTLAIFYELAVGLILRLGMMVYMAFSGIDVVEDNEYSMSDGDGSFGWTQQPLSMGFASGPGRVFTTAAAANEENYLPVFGRDHPIVYSIYLFINAFLLAALVEEICKYFGFRMIETPDFLSRKDLEDAARAGVVDDVEDSSNYRRHGGLEEGHNQQTQRRISFPFHGKSLEAQGAAITVAMVCVALGFSICEDLIYIFLYNGSSVQMEVYVLIARTLFPIHPIAAALQSIGVIERDVEKCPTRFGRILLPAVLFHGTYDFLLLWIDFLASLSRSDGYHDNDDEALEVGSHALILSYTISTAVMGAALFWFYKESNRQRDRLAALDAADPPEN